jgi:glutathione S-transferase
MIMLYTFGPAFSLPDPSPFVTKAEVLLKMSGLPYETTVGDVRKAPKRKMPYIDDGSTIVADSTLIRFHLEDRYGIDFDRGLSTGERAVAWAVEKMLEDHLYWIVVRERWMDDDAFDSGPRRFFDVVPAMARPLVVAMIRREVKRNLYGQGTGRHTLAEMQRIAGRSIDALAAILGDRPWLGGNEPCGADATGFAFVAGLLCPHFDTPSRRHAQRHANLVAYRDRGMEHWFAQLAR